MHTDRFTVEPHGQATALIRNATPALGRPYRHSCPLAAFEKVVYAIEEVAGEFSGAAIVLATGLPSSQVTAALAFLWERSILDRRGKRLSITSRNIVLDAMTEYHALSEGSPGSATGGGGE